MGGEVRQINKTKVRISKEKYDEVNRSRAEERVLNQNHDEEAVIRFLIEVEGLIIKI